MDIEQVTSDFLLMRSSEKLRIQDTHGSRVRKNRQVNGLVAITVVALMLGA